MHPAELLGSAAMRRVLDTLRTRFDRDPHRHAAGRAARRRGRLRPPLADGILMIVRAGVTPKPAIERALSGLDMTQGPRPGPQRRGRYRRAAYGYGGDGYAAG